MVKFVRLALVGILSILLATGCSAAKDTVHRLRYGNDRVTHPERRGLDKSCGRVKLNIGGQYVMDEKVMELLSKILENQTEMSSELKELRGKVDANTILLEDAEQHVRIIGEGLGAFRE